MIIGIDARPLGGQMTGIGFYLLNILKRLDDNENTYILYTHKKIDIELKLRIKYEIRYIKAKFGPLMIAYKINKHLKKDNVDCFWGPNQLIPKKKIKGVKYVLTVHDLALLINKKWGGWKNYLVQKSFNKSSIKNADTIISVSNSTKRDIMNIFKTSENKINVVYCSCNPIGLSSLKSMNNIEASSYILFVGTLDYKKNIINMLKGFIKYKEESNSKIKFVLAGKMGNAEAEINKVVNSSKYKEDIIFTGYITSDERKYLYNNCLFYMFVSNYEGFGVPILEAYSCNKIVLVANNSSLKEIAGDFAPYVNDSSSVDQIAIKINEIMNYSSKDEEELYEKISKQLEKFSWDDCAKETFNILTDKN